MIAVVIPIRTVSEANRRGHWRVAHARSAEQRRVTSLVWRASRHRPSLPAVVRLVRVAPRMLDEGDNLPSAMKAIRDQVAVEIGLPVNARGHADDRDPRVRWEYGQERGGRGEYAVRVEVRSEGAEG